MGNGSVNTYTTKEIEVMGNGSVNTYTTKED